MICVRNKEHFKYNMQINPFDLQEKEISSLKTTFDDNLLTISKQLEFLQKSLRKREKSIGSAIRRKDKVRLGLPLVYVVFNF